MFANAKVYVYVSDKIIPASIGFTELLEAWEKDELKPFELVRSAVEHALGRIRCVRLYGTYFNPKTMTAVIEYLVDFEELQSSGTTSVKIVHAKDPSKAIAEYYEAEKSGKLIRCSEKTRVRIKWIEEALSHIHLSDNVKRRVEEWVKELRREKLERLREYEETGDALVCPLIDPYREGGLLVKIVKHKGRYMVAAGLVEHGGFVEEYYVAEIEIL